MILVGIAVVVYLAVDITFLILELSAPPPRWSIRQRSARRQRT